MQPCAARRRSASSLHVPKHCAPAGEIAGAVPPAAAQRLEQGGGVGIPAGLRLYHAVQCLLIGGLGGQQRQIVDGSQLELAPGNLETGGGGLLRRGGGAQRICVRLQSAQAVGDVLKGGDDRAAVLRRGLVEGSFGGALFVQQGAGVE